MEKVADHNMYVILTGYWVRDTSDLSMHIQAMHPEVAQYKGEDNFLYQVRLEGTCV